MEFLDNFRRGPTRIGPARAAVHPRRHLVYSFKSACHYHWRDFCPLPCLWDENQLHSRIQRAIRPCLWGTKQDHNLDSQIYLELIQAEDWAQTRLFRLDAGAQWDGHLLLLVRPNSSRRGKTDGELPPPLATWLHGSLNRVRLLSNRTSSYA